MLISAPRSGSTWGANWLTTDTTLCLHDPLWTRHYSELDAIQSTKMLGIACTGIALFPDWLDQHPARKVILHRPLDQVDTSLAAIGLTECAHAWDGVLERVRGLHFDWRVLWDAPAQIYEFLLQRPFDAERFEQLRQMRVQPDFERVEIDPAHTQRMVRAIGGAP
jgi:hypothetical protein